MIVVDTNVIAYMLLTGDRSAQAERAYHKDPEWAAPLLWRGEFRNVLALYLRKRILSLPEALQVMESAIGLMEGREFRVPSRDVLSLVADSDCSAYDCEFIALAQDLGTRLVTCDRGILRQFQAVAVSLDVFAADEMMGGAL